MKIVIVSPAYPLRGGIANFTAQLYAELIKNNQVNVFTFKRQYPKIFFPGKSQIDNGEDVDKIPTQITIDSTNPLSWIETSVRIKSLTPDLVIFAYWLPFFAPCFRSIVKRIKKKSNVKTLALCHNIIPHEKRLGDRYLTKSFLSKMDYFITLSEDVKKDLELFIQKPKFKVLPHPIYSRFGDSVSKEEAIEKLNLAKVNYILFFGFIRKYKGLDTLINAMALLKNYPDIKCIVAGEFYEDEKHYLDLITKSGLEKDIILFNDFIPTKEVKYYFSAADVVILPYRNATQSGIVQMAVNFQKPVIATNVGGISEVIEDNKTGFIVEKENPQALAEAILKFYKDRKEEIFSKNMLLLKEKYSWESFVNGMFELISS